MIAENRALERRIRQQVIARTHRFFAIVQPGFETVARDELIALGAHAPVAVEGGVEFDGRLGDCYRIHLCARTIVRVLMRLGAFRADRFERLRDKISAMPWELHLGAGVPVACSCTARASRLYHTGRLEQELRAGIAARMDMPAAVAADDADSAQTVFLRIENDRCQVSLDASGMLLHRRGYRREPGSAPLRETTAAAILLAAGARLYDVIIDPMCGSGTLAIEAGLLLAGMPPGANRPFIFQKWPAFRPAAFEHLRKSIIDPPAPIALPEGKSVLASDGSERSVKAALVNVDAAGLAGLVSVSRIDFFSLEIPPATEERALIVLNPPYGKRSATGGDVKALYRRIGERLRTRFPHAGYAIIVPGLECEKALGLPHDRKILFMNGGIRVAALIRDGRTPAG